MPPISILSMMITTAPALIAALGALQLEPDVDEVVRRPRARVLERQLLVARVDLLDLRVERRLLLAGDQEGAVEDHLVADRLVGARGHADVAERLEDLGLV